MIVKRKINNFYLWYYLFNSLSLNGNLKLTKVVFDLQNKSVETIAHVLKLTVRMKKAR